MNDENNLSSVYEDDEDTFEVAENADLDAKMESAIATAQGQMR